MIYNILGHFFLKRVLFPQTTDLQQRQQQCVAGWSCLLFFRVCPSPMSSHLVRQKVKIAYKESKTQNTFPTKVNTMIHVFVVICWTIRGLILQVDCRHLVYLDHIMYFYWLLDINVASHQLHQIQTSCQLGGYGVDGLKRVDVPVTCGGTYP